MFIAVSANDRDLNAAVSETLEKCRFLLIVNMEDGAVTAIENYGDETGAALAAAVIEADCEAIITGGLSPAAFDLIADANITRYDGYGHPAGSALGLMDQYKLKLIRNPEKTEECDSHHESSCDGHLHSDEE
jgi:predicted Fe-Mo cluster-binding NifX family protein